MDINEYVSKYGNNIDINNININDTLSTILNLISFDIENIINNLDNYYKYIFEFTFKDDSYLNFIRLINLKIILDNYLNNNIERNILLNINYKEIIDKYCNIYNIKNNNNYLYKILSIENIINYDIIEIKSKIIGDK